MIRAFLIGAVIVLLACRAGAALAGTHTPPADAAQGSSEWLSTPATVVAGQPEYVFCAPDATMTMNGVHYDAWTGIGQTPPSTEWWGWQITMGVTECGLLWHPQGQQGWWLAGHAAAALAHELAHDQGQCGDTAADAWARLTGIRTLQAVLGYRGIHVHPKQRRWALAGIYDETRAPHGTDPINVGCADWTGP